MSAVPSPDPPDIPWIIRRCLCAVGFCIARGQHQQKHQDDEIESPTIFVPGKSEAVFTNGTHNVSALGVAEGTPDVSGSFTESIRYSVDHLFECALAAGLLQHQQTTL